MIEPDILKKIGLEEKDATDLVQKHSRYLESLNRAQYQLVKDSLPSWEEAAKTISPECTAQDLLKFVKARGGAADPVGALCVCVGRPKRI